MTIRKLLACLLTALIMTGCAQKPEPEAEKVKAMEAEEVSEEKLTVRHHVQGNSLYVECFVPDISFSAKQSGKQLGKVLLYIDGQLYNEYSTAAFMVKNLPSGAHTFTVEIVNKDNRPLGMSRDFTATIE
ncbi:hypothetical protein ACFSCZ_03280 [Siminovitchia sediminis]|uniref:Lipoprotein n=1 Tax=Siminovitchia sediminis TaxID=1274353 RepID=A0ABW4KC45_9BACI